jgi:hypothetical protein
VTYVRLVGGQNGPDAGCREWVHRGCRGSDRERCRRRERHGIGEAVILVFFTFNLYHSCVLSQDAEVTFIDLSKWQLLLLVCVQMQA